MPTTTLSPIRRSKQPGFAERIWCVLKAWVRNPTEVATVCPSSPFLTKHLAERDCVRKASRIVELGPGAGGTTQALLASMRTDARLLAIEKTDAFAESLGAITDPRLTLEFADACDLIDLVTKHDFGKVDVAISGIPFSHLPSMSAKRIIQSVHEVLRPGGVFIAYQLTSDVKDYARPLFGPPKTEIIPMNLPPLQSFDWTKVEAGCDPASDCS
ncbi:class I SAM-dependent methyltransferase [Rhodopirellula sp. JC639]|uniref:class I SAM-dependent methyltransferase n=1 Tax=Stieleria mannarensis TaxID=2755585 RepID=UPI00256FD07D|nr:methyltransferase domain-containing protein [Rhodopirellula sp. JC639]